MAVPGVRVNATTITANTNHAGVTRLSGFSIREANAVTPGPAAINLRDGTASGQILVVLELGADQSATLLSPAIVHAPNGVYVEVVAGTISGVLYDSEWAEVSY